MKSIAIAASSLKRQRPNVSISRINVKKDTKPRASLYRIFNANIFSPQIENFTFSLDTETNNLFQTIILKNLKMAHCSFAINRPNRQNNICFRQ